MAEMAKDAVTTTDIRARFDARFSSSVRFRISERMVARFASLIGDHSALHVNEGFARRSIYRRTLVHGILPVTYLSFLPGLRIDGYVCTLTAITARFTSPVYVNDLLDLRINAVADGPSANGIIFDYAIQRVTNDTTVTKGTITVAYRQGPVDRLESSDADDSTCVLTSPITGLVLSHDDILKGRSESFEFTVTDAAIGSLIALTADGFDDQESVVRLEGQGAFDYANLLTVTLLSTLVGMRLPGHSATFIEFSAELDQAVKRDVLLRLQGVVTHVSRATNIIRTDVTVYDSHGDEHDRVLRGKVAALVNPAPSRMPTIQELKTSALDMGLKDKVVLITGASRGIGETIAKLMALHEARIIVNYHAGREDAERIVREIRSMGADAAAIQADVTSLEQVRRMVVDAQDRFGAIHVLVNNAVRDYRPVPFLNLTWEEVQMDLDVVAKGAFHCCREVIPIMLQAGGGKIINLSTVAVDNPPMDQAKYVMAKSALVGLTRSLSVEFAARNIQVNLVVPSFVETDLVSHIPDGFRKEIAKNTGMQRHASPVDVAQAVLFLASSRASFTTGQKIMVTGGGAPYL